MEETLLKWSQRSKIIDPEENKKVWKCLEIRCFLKICLCVVCVYEKKMKEKTVKQAVSKQGSKTALKMDRKN